MPPPDCAVFPESVDRTSVAVPDELIPPPLFPAMLSLIVESVMERLLVDISIPPPFEPVVLFESTIELLSVTGPEL